MTTRNNTLYIEDILTSIKKILRYTEGMSFDAFLKNEIVIDAVIRNLEIIGEAAKKIPEDIKNSNSDIPWKRMIGLRNIVVHEYFGIDFEIIWQIATKNLPSLKPLITDLFKKYV